MMRSTSSVQHILCATDLTPRSAAAWNRAVSLARLTGARLTLLHVIKPGQPERAARVRANRAYAALLAEADRALGTSSGIDIAVHRGNVRDVIVSAASELNVDLVVIAAPKSRRFDPIVGTTAERLVRAAKRPVLVVRREVEGGYRNVAIAADLSPATAPMISTALRLGALDSASATVVHAVTPPYEGMMKYAGLDASIIERYQYSEQQAARQRLQTIISDAGLPFASTRMIVRNDPAATMIHAVLEYEQPEVLAIGASRWFLLKRLLIGSVADRVLRTAPCDVLVIPNQPSSAVAVRGDTAVVSRPVSI